MGVLLSPQEIPNSSQKITRIIREPMPYTVAASFDKFIENISLTGDHREIADSRKDRVVSLLENTFTILDSFPTGSIPRHTALKGSADLDVIVVLHWSKHIKDKTPAQVLKSVRDALGKYRTNVRRNGQAVTLYYDSWPNVDIAPVSRTENDDGSVNYYNVPDMHSGRWLRARPRKHSATLEAKASICGSRFRPIIRMVKEWNKSHSELVESFHIEVMALSVFSSDISEYPWFVYRYFDEAVNLVSAPLAYEEGYADEYLDWSKRQEVKRRFEAARDRAVSAWYCTYSGRSEHEKAISIWRQIFGDKFPAYG